MATKLISERKAMEKLSKAIGEDIDTDDMALMANHGVVPAYMVFRPKDKITYPGHRFHLRPFSGGITDACDEESWESDIQELPYPLSKGGLFRAGEWETSGGQEMPVDGLVRTYEVLALRADGILEAIDEAHYVREYADPEVNQSVQNVKNYRSGGDWSETPHGYCESYDFDRSHTPGVFEFSRGISPFAPMPGYANPNKRTTKSAKNGGNIKIEENTLTTISALLEIIKELSKERNGREWTQGDINKKVLSTYPDMISHRTVGGLFSAANKRRDILLADLRELSAAAAAASQG